MRATGLVVSRELHEAFRRKSIWVVMAILFAGSCAAMVLPGLLDGGRSRFDVAVVSPSPSTATAFEQALTPIVREQGATVGFHRIEDTTAARLQVEDDDVDIAVVLGAKPVIVTRAPDDDVLVVATRQAIAASALVGRAACPRCRPGISDRVTDARGQRRRRSG